jgi:hypothetical protein
MERSLARWPWFIIVPALFATGCMPKRNLAVHDLPAIASPFVEDRTLPDSYPGFGAGEGNIYSCRYGISIVRADEFVPPKARMFEALLARERPAIEQHRVVLHRFDVYNNTRLKMQTMVGEVMGGWLGHSLASGARRAGGDHFVSERMIVDVNPESFEPPEDEKAVGCEGRDEGEYFASRVSSGHSVIVTWLKFDVDEHAFHVRTYFQHQAETPEERDSAVSEAARLSVKAAAMEIATRLGG